MEAPRTMLAPVTSCALLGGSPLLALPVDGAPANTDAISSAIPQVGECQGGLPFVAHGNGVGEALCTTVMPVCLNFCWEET